MYIRSHGFSPPHAFIIIIMCVIPNLIVPCVHVIIIIIMCVIPNLKFFIQAAKKVYIDI